MNRMDRGRPNRRPWCETIRRRERRRARVARWTQEEACRGPRARAAPDARRGHPDPAARLRRRPRRGAGRPRPGPRRPAARTAIDGHVRLLLAWTGAINLTAVRDPLAAATVHVLDSLTGGRAAARPGHRALCSTWARAAGCPGIPLAAALPAARRAARRADRQEGALPRRRPSTATGLEDRVAVAATRAEALAADPPTPRPLAGRHGPGRRADGRARRARLPAARRAAAVLVAWKRGDLTAELAAARRGDRRARAAGDSRSSSRSGPGPGRAPAGRRHPDRRRARTPTHATRRRASAARGEPAAPGRDRLLP